jgi:signal transduction histidine kinase
MGASKHDRADFLATLRHALRNVLAPMSNAVHLVKVSTDPATRAQAREMIERQTSLLNRHVDDLLGTSRLTSLDLRLEMRDLDVVAVVRNAAYAARARIEERGQRFDVECCAESLTVRGDEMRLMQGLTSLLNNASRYGTLGGSVRLSIGRAERDALIRVVDDGIGIDASMLPRIFDGGFAIGLALVKRITELHGGRVAALSDGPGRGSEFLVRLPLVESAATR